MFDHPKSPVTDAPTAIAGLKAPPEMPPTANAPVTTVKQDDPGQFPHLAPPGANPGRHRDAL